MRPKSSKSNLAGKVPAGQLVKDIRRATRRHFSAEGKIRIVVEDMRGDDSLAELCRREGIAQSRYDTGSKAFMEAGKRRLAGDTAQRAPLGQGTGFLIMFYVLPKMIVSNGFNSPMTGTLPLLRPGPASKDRSLPVHVQSGDRRVRRGR